MDRPGRTGCTYRRRLLREEQGQSLVIVIVSMFVVIVVAALAIDLSTWYQKHHSAQVAADASALAAANYMANGGAAGTATGTATTYASANHLPISSNNVSVNTQNETVTVTVPTTGQFTFAGISLGSQPSISARAVASWAQHDCSTSGSSCAFMYAYDPVCSGNTNVTGYVKNQTTTIGHGITITKNGTGSAVSLNGAIISSSNINTAVDGNPTFNSMASYSNGIGCTGPSPSSPAPYSAAFSRPVPSVYPVDYSKIYSACGTTSMKFGAVACDSAGFPNYCTASQESTAATDTISVSAPANAVICDAGTGTKSDPSTWNGTIVQNNGASDTYIAGTVQLNVPTGSTMQPAANNQLLAYGAACNASTPAPATCNSTPTTTSPAVQISSSGNATVSGDVFALAGTIDTNLSGNPSYNGFLEGYDVVYNASGTVTGAGPAVNSADQWVCDSLTS